VPCRSGHPHTHLDIDHRRGRRLMPRPAERNSHRLRRGGRASKRAGVGRRPRRSGAGPMPWRWTKRRLAVTKGNLLAEWLKAKRSPISSWKSSPCSHLTPTPLLPTPPYVAVPRFAEMALRKGVISQSGRQFGVQFLITGSGSDGAVVSGASVFVTGQRSVREQFAQHRQGLVERIGRNGAECAY
jgi:hypothetical protein